jgi:hypothetical protein
MIYTYAIICCSLTCRLWWRQAVEEGSARVLPAVALSLLDIVPHAAATERTFSAMNYIMPEYKGRMDVGTLEMLATIKSVYENNLDNDSTPKRRDHDQEIEGDETDLFGDPSIQADDEEENDNDEDVGEEEVVEDELEEEASSRALD